MDESPRPEIRFAPARPDDADIIRELARQAYRRHVDVIGREPAPMTADYSRIATSGETVLAWRGDDLVGMLVTATAEDSLTIENVAVAADTQGSGLGSELLAQAERLAVAAGVAEIRLFTNEMMVDNVAFYRRRGYAETHRAVVDGYRRVFFVKGIRP
jgi:ribosomal protein S18 acetylase RimI-like enzyme